MFRPAGANRAVSLAWLRRFGVGYLFILVPLFFWDRSHLALRVWLGANRHRPTRFKLCSVWAPASGGDPLGTSGCNPPCALPLALVTWAGYTVGMGKRLIHSRLFFVDSGDPSGSEILLIPYPAGPSAVGAFVLAGGIYLQSALGGPTKI